jgi:hypothetical protein
VHRQRPPRPLAQAWQQKPAIACLPLRWLHAPVGTPGRLAWPGASADPDPEPAARLGPGHFGQPEPAVVALPGRVLAGPPEVVMPEPLVPTRFEPSEPVCL